MGLFKLERKLAVKTHWKSIFVLSILALPAFAGALRLEVGSPALNPEAQKNHAVLVARITACNSPEKTTVSATAEGVLNGVRQSIPLKVISLSTAGTFAVAHEWPQIGESGPLRWWQPILNTKTMPPA